MSGFHAFVPLGNRSVLSRRALRTFVSFSNFMVQTSTNTHVYSTSMNICTQTVSLWVPLKNWVKPVPPQGNSPLVELCLVHMFCYLFSTMQHIFSTMFNVNVIRPFFNISIRIFTHVYIRRHLNANFGLFGWEIINF